MHIVKKQIDVCGGEVPAICLPFLIVLSINSDCVEIYTTAFFTLLYVVNDFVNRMIFLLVLPSLLC